MITENELAQIENRLNAGEQWSPADCEIKVMQDNSIFVSSPSFIGNTLIALDGHYEDYQSDWLFIANARKDMRLLLEELKQAKKAHL